MKSIVKTMLTAVILLCCGCTAVAQAEQTTDDTNVVTADGTVESVSDGDVVISYQSEKDNQTVTASVPSTAIILKDNSTVHCEDLQEDDKVTISFANGKMSVIQVQPDKDDQGKQPDDSSTENNTDASAEK